MKRKVCLLFTFVVMMCLMACLSINVSAAEIESTGQCGENAYWSFDESTGTLTISGTGEIDDAVVFDEEAGYFVTNEDGNELVNMPWYDFKNQIYTLVIEEGITEIGAFAFYSLFYLTKVEFPSTLEISGHAAFCECIRLEELNFPDGVKTLYCSSYNEIAIKKIVFPKSLESISPHPYFNAEGIFDFSMCVYLESLTIPEEIGAIEAVVDFTNTSIRNIYNYSTEAIIKFDNGGVSQYWWGDEATAEYMTVSIGAALASIEYEMTEEEQEAFVLEKIIEYYGEDYAEKIPEPVLIETVPDYIKVYCYENSAQHLYCVENGINFVLIDENTHLDSNNDCICDICGLKHMCGEKVYYEFDDVTGTLTIKGEGEMYDFLSEPDDEEEGRIAPWRYHPQAILYVVIDEGVASVGDYAFYEEFSLEEVSIASTVRRIGRSAFIDSDVKEVVITNGVERIEDNAFNNGEINSVVIPESVTYMHFSAFGEAMVYVSENNPMYSSDEYGVLFDKEKTVLLNYPNCNTDLAEYDVPDSVEIINTAAFRLSSLKKVTLGSALKEVGDLSFERAKIESIIFPDSVEYIGYEAFYDCDDLTEVKFGSGLKQIGYQAFLSCSWLGEIYIPANVYEIEYRAFAYCRNLQCVVVDENNINYSHVDEVLFNKEQNKLILYPLGKTATTYSIPETVKEIGSCAFEGSGLTSVLIPDGVTDVGEYAFNCCENLLSVVIPKGVLSIGMAAFVSSALQDIYYCGTEEQWNNIEKSVYGIMITDNVVVHYNYDVTSPTVVKSGICGENVTYELYSDGTLIIDGEGPMYDYGEIEGEADIVFPPYVNYFYDEADEYGEYSGDFDIKKVIIKDGVTRIGNYAFQACRNLEEVEIADTVTSIGTVAFDFCTSLKHLKIPGSVKVLEQEAFSESALETIEIEEGLERIETLAFFYCLNLKEVSLPESVEYIGDFAFIICDKLETLVINNKACEIGLEILMTGELDEDGNIIEDENGNPIPTECPTVLKGYSGSTAEEYANAWTEVGYPIKFVALDSHSHLDSDNDGNCDNCGEIFIVNEGNCGAEGDNVTWELLSNGNLTISGNGAMADNFFEFGKLDVKNVIIESGVTSIGSWAFARCDDLVSIEIPDTVTSIGDSAFSGCESLTAVTIPASVTTIGKAAFFNCKNLGSVAIPAGITSISELSFCGCKNLTSVSIKKSVTSVGKTAFDGCTSLADVYYDGTAQDWDKITIKSGNDPLINATKNFGAVCRHTEDGHETVTTEEIIDEPTFFDDGSYAEITKCKNCGAELSREIKTIPDVSLLDTIAEEIEEFFKGPISAIANVFKRILRIFGKR